MKTIDINTFSLLLLSVLFFFGGSSTIIAAPWDLDPAFGSGGKLVWSPNSNTQSISGSGMALQADGKIVMVGGYSETAAGPSFMVVRFNANGSLDTTFGTSGWTVVTFGGTSESASSVAIQPDGKIVAGGRTTLPSSGYDVAIARLNSDGTLDSTFSEDGKVTVGFTVSQSGTLDYLNVIKVANGGKIVFAGGSGPGPSTLYYANIGRLNSDGSLDSSFGNGGLVIDGLGSGFNRDLIPNADGSIYVVGDASAQFSSSRKVRKYNDDGSTAWTFAETIQPGCYMSLNSMAVQTNGKLVVAGSKDCRATAIRINSDGSLDNTFNSEIVASSSQSFTVSIQPDGKILATIAYQSNNNDGYSLLRYNTDGSLDTGFGQGGVSRIRVLNGNESAKNIVIQPDGKILLGGSASVTVSTGYRFAMVRYLGASSVPFTPLFDYDGDGRADVSVFRPSENKWYITRSSNGQIDQEIFAISNDVAVPADYDGDGKTDMAIFRASSGDWWYLSSLDGGQKSVHWGASGDIPRPGDFDGDGKADFIVFRPSENNWYRFGSTAVVSIVNFGLAGDKSVIGDFDGDGKSDPAIYRPSTGTWWYQSSLNNAQIANSFGISTDIPVPADFDGDGKTDIAVYRPSTGVWYILNSSSGQATIVGFGLSEDKPVAADYDGDGKADIAVFRPSTGIWYLLKSTSGFEALQFGVSTDIPIPNAFIN